MVVKHPHHWVVPTVHRPGYPLLFIGRADAKHIEMGVMISKESHRPGNPASQIQHSLHLITHLHFPDQGVSDEPVGVDLGLAAHPVDVEPVMDAPVRPPVLQLRQPHVLVVCGHFPQVVDAHSFFPFNMVSISGMASS